MINGPERENAAYLPGHKCPPRVHATTSLQEAVHEAELILLVVPTQFIASVAGVGLMAIHVAGCAPHDS